MITRDETPAVRTAHSVRTAGVVLLLTLVALSPWPFGSANPSGQFVLAVALLVLAGLWTAYAIHSRRIRYRSDAVTVCLLGLVLITALQLVPLPDGLVQVLSPRTLEWNRALIPETPELLPGESDAAVPPRPSWVRLSIAPSATEDLLIQFLTVALVYVMARNFAVDEQALKRLAWVGLATGLALALMALTQYLGGNRELIYGRFNAGGEAYGPFINKNHFSFQLHLFIGLTIGLLLRVAHRGGLRTPQVAGLVGCLGLMVAAVGLSQSRGGALSLLTAALLTWGLAHRLRRDVGNRRIGLVLLGGVILVGGILTAWLGWTQMLNRFASLWQGTADNRSAVWVRAWQIAREFPLTGVGGGAYSAVELATRSGRDSSYISVSAHNEYLEALVEGGIVRLALTIGLVLASIRAAARHYRRTGDPLLLGGAFGLIALAIHSIGDFGIHVPSVALAAAVVAAYCSTPRSREIKQETQDWRQESADPGQEALNGPASRSHYHPALAAVFLLAALLVVAADWRLWRVDRLRAGAALALRPGDAASLLEAAARLRPNDPWVSEELALAHLLAAAESGQTALAGVVGFAVLAQPIDVLPEADPDGHVSAALRAARAGRNLLPISAGQHLRLGTFAHRFARSEPAQVHLERAKRIGSVEPDVWYVCGNLAAMRGDWGVAMSDWRESLSRSTRRLGQIARTAAGHVPPVEFRTRVLPDDPAVWFAAAPHLLADDASADWSEWMRAIDQRSSRSEPDSVAGFLAWGSALEELRDLAGAIRVWRRAVDRYPEDIAVRDRLAMRLESEELYEDALPVLEWLVTAQPDRGQYRHRLAAAKHALKLKAEIDRP